mmetsp:Transcript_14488/g.47604  ORF Transcript_14488/g.47604 Transcript_14488/m.47604 type:complete len:243 (+) Transcript_14488:2-730(+)
MGEDEVAAAAEEKGLPAFARRLMRTATDQLHRKVRTHIEELFSAFAAATEWELDAAPKAGASPAACDAHEYLESVFAAARALLPPRACGVLCGDALEHVARVRVRPLVADPAATVRRFNGFALLQLELDLRQFEALALTAPGLAPRTAERVFREPNLLVELVLGAAKSDAHSIGSGATHAELAALVPALEKYRDVGAAAGMLARASAAVSSASNTPTAGAGNLPKRKQVEELAKRIRQELRS